MRLATVCSGIGAPELAAESVGWDSVWHAEIERFPSRVLAARYPGSVNLGDMTEIVPSEVLREHGEIDVLMGGTPCQSFSVAGLRRGLDDPRGNLALEFLRLVDGLRPRWFCWENVPGALSSWTGPAAARDLVDGWGWESQEDSDCGCFLEAAIELGYGLAWRVLDARFFGVPQRRRRIFVVGYLGGGWAAPGAVLFEHEGLRGDSAAGGAPGQDLAGTLGGGAGNRGWCDDLDRCGAFVSHTLTGEGHDAGEDGSGIGVPLVAPKVSAKWAKGSGGPSGDESQNLIVGARQAPSSSDIAGALDTHGHSQAVVSGPLCAEGGRAAGGGASPLVFDTTQVTSVENGSNPQPGDPCHTLVAGAHAPAVAQSVNIRGREGGAMAELHDSDVATTLRTGGGGQSKPHILTSMVRRLTPMECERLQGFPDGWTDVPDTKGRPAADAPRYRALGNSMAVPVVRWIFMRLAVVDKAIADAGGADDC